MIPLLLLGGAAAGALLNKKNPLQGALLGAGIGATGGLLGGAAAGAGAAGSAAGSTAATQTAGLLGVPGAASGAGSQAALLAAQNQGFGAIGQQLTAQAAGGASGMAVPTSVNIAAGLERAGEAAGGLLDKAKPVMTAASAASPFMPEPEQAPPPAQIQSNPLDLSGIFSMNAEEQKREFENQMRRRGLLDQYTQSIMRG
jgi:hypothetical protein